MKFLREQTFGFDILTIIINIEGNPKILKIDTFEYLKIYIKEYKSIQVEMFLFSFFFFLCNTLHYFTLLYTTLHLLLYTT